MDWTEQWPLLALIGAALVGGLLVVARRLLAGRSSEEGPGVSAPEAFELGRLAADLPDSGPLAEIYGVPVRVTLGVVAPAGRGEELTTSRAQEVLSQLVPQVAAVLASHGTRVQLWPPQLSAQGFQVSFFQALAAGRGDDTTWCGVCGKRTVGQRQYLVGLVCRMASPQPIGELVVEHEARWLDVLRVHRGS